MNIAAAHSDTRCVCVWEGVCEEDVWQLENMWSLCHLCSQRKKAV